MLGALVDNAAAPYFAREITAPDLRFPDNTREGELYLVLTELGQKAA